MQSVESTWESSRAAIFKAVLESQAVPSPDALCFICGKAAVILCCQCGPRVLMCSTCDEEIHEKKPLHDRDVWMNEFFQEIPPTTTVRMPMCFLVHYFVIKGNPKFTKVTLLQSLSLYYF